MTEQAKSDRELGELLSRWDGAKLPEPQRITGRFCDLVPTDISDHAADLFAAFQKGEDAGDWAYLPYGPFGSQGALEDWMKQVCLGADPLFFTIIDRSSGQATGVASYLNIVPANGSIEVGHIHFSPLIQRSPVATESMYLMMRHVFDQGFRRYEWKCNSLNQRSRRAAQRLGFSYEGIFRQHFVSKGRNRDTAWYAMIDNEWPTLKAAFETWLSDANFDSDGNQIESLSALTGPVLVSRG